MARRRRVLPAALLLLGSLAVVTTPSTSIADNHFCPGGGPCIEVPVCPENHEAVQRFADKVGYSLDHIYNDMVTLGAKGYIPYFDIAFFGPVGELTGSFTHWLHPAWIDDEVMLDPFRPESVLVDQWGRPIGMMFIAREGQHPGPPFVDENGEEVRNAEGDVCHPPWHTHTDLPARYAWWHYKTVYQGQPDMIPDYTPEMFHVWHPKFPGSIYAHNGPSNQHRDPAGPPPVGIVPPLSQP